MKANIKIQMIILLKIMAFSAVLSVAQLGPGIWQERLRQMESRRVAYLTSELELTPQEAQVFWPVYNEFKTKRNELILKHRAHRFEEVDIESLSDRELVQLAETEIVHMEEMARLRREYHEKFKRVLPAKKLVKLYEAERGFHRQLLEERRLNRPALPQRRNGN